MALHKRAIIDALKSHLKDAGNLANHGFGEMISGVQSVGTNLFGGLSSSSAELIAEQVKDRDLAAGRIKALDVLSMGRDLVPDEKKRRSLARDTINKIRGTGKTPGSLETLQNNRLGSQVLAGGLAVGALVGTGLLAKSLYDRMKQPKDKLSQILDTRDSKDGANLHN